MLKSPLSLWFFQSPEVTLQLEIISADAQCLALTCRNSYVVLLNCEGGLAVLCNSRNSSSMTPEDKNHFSMAMWRKLNLAGISCFRTHCYSGSIYETLLRSCCLPHICRRRWHREDCENDKRCFMFLSFLERKHAQCGVIMVRDSDEAFVEMWVEQRVRCA